MRNKKSKLLKIMQLSESQAAGPNQKKYKMVYDLLAEIETMKDTHHSKYITLRDMQTYYQVTTNLLNASTMTSLFVLLSATGNPIVPIVGAVLSSTTLLLSAVKTGYKLDDKLNRFHVSDLQFDELYREIRQNLLKTNMGSADITLLISEINGKLSLIQDSSL
jgi:hypothetical protein